MTDVAMFHMEHIENTQSDQTVSRCKCGGERRPGQRNCAECHSAANRAYRARMKEKAAKLRAAYNGMARLVRDLQQERAGQNEHKKGRTGDGR